MNVLVLRALFVLAALGTTVVLTTGDVLWRLDHWLYDQTLYARTWQPETDSRILIVAVDEHSLAQLGQWPWSRSVHAEAIRRLTRAGARGIAFDLMFAEAHGGDAQGDAELAAAMAEANNVVLPVSVARKRQHGQVVEVMPLPDFSRAARALGHTDLAEDADGLTRGVYLRAGLGEPRWSTLSLALLEGALFEADGRTSVDQLPGLARPESRIIGPGSWARDRYVLLPFSGPPGTLTHVPYSDLLEGRVPDELVRGRWIVVGMGASGHAGSVKTPIEKGRDDMRGIEFHAQVLKALLDESLVTPMARTGRIVLSCLFVLLPFVIYNLVSFRITLIVFGSAILLLLTGGAVLLFGLNRWFPPAVPMTVLAACLPVLLALRLKRFQRLAIHDSLTGLTNRRGFSDAFAREWRGAMRSRHEIALILTDVDYFKAYNDRYGHPEGDRILREISRIIQRYARRARDVAARVGGEEFAILLPETGTAGALRIAEELRSSVAALELRHEDSPFDRTVTLSIGVHACLPVDGEDRARLYDCADKALYHAKTNGRNRVSLYEA